jgi:hypothetical protein
MDSDESKIAKVLANIETLSTVAASLNTASDELTKVVGIFDGTLRKLNIGLTVWTSFRYRTGEDDSASEYDQDQLGYAKVQGTWGITLRRIWGDEARDVFSEEGPWHFSDAPRDLRLAAAGYIPQLIESLAKAAADTTKEVQEKTKQARELASAIEKRANESKTARLVTSVGAAMKLSDLAKGGK